MLNATEKNLTAVHYEDGSGYSFAYADDGLMTAKTDPRSSQFSYAYD